MASRRKPECEEENEDDIEKLRLAALQSLHTSKVVAQELVPIKKYVKDGCKGDFRSKGTRGEPFNGKKHCYRVNSNLITIVPVLDVSKQVSGVSQPQKENRDVKSHVPSKFSRYNDADSENSEDENERISSDNNVNTGTPSLPEANSLVEDNEEESLDKLMDQLEQEINASERTFTTSSISPNLKTVLPSDVGENKIVSEYVASHTTVGVNEEESNAPYAKRTEHLFSSPQKGADHWSKPDIFSSNNEKFSCINEASKVQCTPSPLQNITLLLRRSNSPVNSLLPLNINKQSYEILPKSPAPSSSYPSNITDPTKAFFPTNSVSVINIPKSVSKSRSNSRSPISRQRSNSRSPISRQRSDSRSPFSRQRSNSRSPISRKRSISRSPVSRKRSSSRSPISRQRSKSPKSPVINHNSRSPDRKRRIGSRSSVRMRRTISRSPIGFKRTISISPIRVRRTVSRSPARVGRTTSRSPICDIRKFSRSPVRRRRTMSRSPVYLMRNVSRSPVWISRSTSRSPVRRLRSISRSPVRLRRSRSPSSPYRKARSPNRRSPFHKRRSITPISPVHKLRPRSSRSPVCLQKYQCIISPRGIVKSRSPNSPLHKVRYSGSVNRSRSPGPPDPVFRKSNSLSPVHNLRHHSPRSPVRSDRSYSSRSPVNIHRSHSPSSSIRQQKARTSMSPARLRSSRSPVSLPQRSCSPTRSAVQASRSPLRKYSRSPQSRYSHRSLSPRNTYSPRKRSPSPRMRHYASPKNALSWQRRQSPDPEKTRQLSPLLHKKIVSSRKRSHSPGYKRRSVSPVSRYVGSTHVRRASASPRRHDFGVIHRSPSASHDKRSPLARFSPPSRSISPKPRRTSRSRSSSPARLPVKITQSSGRSWSPRTNKDFGSSPLRKSSPTPLLRNISSLSPKQHRISSSRSPVRLNINNKSPICDDLEPLKTKLPANDIKFTSGHVRNLESSGNRRDSPKTSHNLLSRKDHSAVENELLPRGRERFEKVHLSRGKNTLSKKNVHSPPKQSPSQKSWSRTPSLSPSPEKQFDNDQHRHKSPLKVRIIEHGKHPVIVVSGREESSNWQKGTTFTSLHDSLSIDKSRRSKLGKLGKSESKRTEFLGRNVTRQGMKWPVKVDVSDQSARDRFKQDVIKIRRMKSQIPSADSVRDSSFVLEARKRKFETPFPVESMHKVVSLKGPSKGATEKTSSKTFVERNSLNVSTDKEGSKVSQEKSVSKISAEKASSKMSEDSSSQVFVDKDKPGKVKEDTDNWCEKSIDELEDLLDLELQNSLDFWMSDGSDSDTDNCSKQKVKWSTSKEENSVDSSTKAISEHGKLGKDSCSENITSEIHGKEKTSSVFHTIEDSPKPNADKRKMDIHNSEHLKKTKGNIEKKSSTKPVSKENKPKISRNDPERHSSSRHEKDAIEHSSMKDYDLRAELSRRRAERLLKAGSLHKTLPARLLQSAFRGVVRSKSIKDPEDSKASTERDLEPREKTDGRRVMVLKSPPSRTEQDVLSLSVTVPKAKKEGKDTTKVPVHLRLGLPSNSWDIERPNSRRRGCRKVKVKRNVVLPSNRGHKV